MRLKTSRIKSNQTHRPSSNCKAAAIPAKPFVPSRGIGAAYFGIIRGIFEVIMRNRQSGFTLIEIMVVVVILAVLGALVVPKILENVDKARVTRAQSDIRAIQTALDLYRLDNFKYPTTEQGLQALVKQPADPTITNYRSGGYLPSLPKDPWNNIYQYQNPGTDGRDYEITTFGRDGKPGGEGYDADISTSTLDQR
jgi:general secretion pathway protein G